MAITWGDIKKAALDKMFTTVEADPSGAQEYVAAMPEVANYALMDLASVCRPISKKYSLSHVPVANMLGDSGAQFSIVQSIGEDIMYAVEDPRAYYFEVDAPCTVLVQQVDDDGVALDITSHVHAGSGSFTAYSGLVDLTGEIRLNFLGDKLYNIRNVAFYATPLAAVANIPPFTRSDRYNLKTLIGATFKRLAPNNTTLTGDGENRRSDEFQWEPDCTLVIDHYVSAQFDIFYEAYPTLIDDTTGDDTVLDDENGLPAEALLLAPLYIAGQLYADENSGLATSYRNQYSVRRAELSNDSQPLGETKWGCTSGWW